MIAIIDMTGRVVELHAECEREYAQRRVDYLNMGSDTNSYRVVTL